MKSLYKLYPQSKSVFTPQIENGKEVRRSAKVSTRYILTGRL